MKLRLFAITTILTLNINQTQAMERIFSWIPFVGSYWNKTNELPKPSFEDRPLYKLRDRASYSLHLENMIEENKKTFSDDVELKKYLENAIPSHHDRFKKADKEAFYPRVINFTKTFDDGTKAEGSKCVFDKEFINYYMQAREVIKDKESRIKHFQANKDEYNKLIRQTKTPQKIKKIGKKIATDSELKKAISLWDRRAIFAMKMDQKISGENINATDVPNYLENTFDTKFTSSRTEYPSFKELDQNEKKAIINYYLNTRNAIKDSEQRMLHFGVSRDAFESIVSVVNTLQTLKKQKQ
jgi:hypothetical protein